MLVVMTAILLLQGAVSEEVYNDVHDRHKFAYMLRHKTHVHVAAICNQFATFRTPWGGEISRAKARIGSYTMNSPSNLLSENHIRDESALT